MSKMARRLARLNVNNVVAVRSSHSDEELVGKGNILQENLYTMLTSEEMIALCRVFAILHHTICLPMRFLAGNSHNIGAQGYDWSTRSMQLMLLRKQ